MTNKKGVLSRTRARAGWVFLFTYASLIAIAVFSQGVPPVVCAFIGIVVAFFVVSRILFTPIGVVIAAIMLVMLTVQNSPANAFITVGSLYAISFVGGSILVSVIWQGNPPEFFPTKRFKSLDRLDNEPFSEDYRLGIVSLFWDLRWRNFGDKHSSPVVDSQVVIAVPEQMTALAVNFSEAGRQKQFAASVADARSTVEQMLKAHLSVMTVPLINEDLRTDEAVTQRTLAKYLNRVEKVLNGVSLDALAWLDIKPEVRIDPKQSWSDTERDYEIAVQWELRICKPKLTDWIYRTNGLVTRTGRWPYNDLLVEILLGELRSAISEVPGIANSEFQARDNSTLKLGEN